LVGGGGRTVRLRALRCAFGLSWGAGQQGRGGCGLVFCQQQGLVGEWVGMCTINGIVVWGVEGRELGG
jgi:hypothetical protein